jgi:hypothetical protein
VRLIHLMDGQDDPSVCQAANRMVCRVVYGTDAYYWGGVYDMNLRLPYVPFFTEASEAKMHVWLKHMCRVA